MRFDDSLYQQGIIPVGAAATQNGYALSDPRAVDSMPDGMKELCWHDEIDAIMDFYGIPKQRVMTLHGKTGRYVSNRDNKSMFLAADIKPVHIPLVEAHFKNNGDPFIGGYLYAKQQYNESREYERTEQQPEGTKRDPITGQLIDNNGNVIKKERPVNYNPYGFNEGDEQDNNINANTNEVPNEGQVGGPSGETNVPVGASESTGEMEGVNVEQQGNTGGTSESTSS